MDDRTVVIKTKGRLTKINEDSQLAPQLLFTLPPEWIDIFKKWNDVELICSRCGLPYNDIENIGSWTCRQHALEYNGDSPGKFYGPYRWDCCGKEQYKVEFGIPNGCVRCDHRPTDINYTRYLTDVVVPRSLLPYLQKFKNESRLEGDEWIEYQAYSQIPWDWDKWAVIRRYDHTETLRRSLYGKTAIGKTLFKGEWVDTRDMSWYGVS